MTAGQRGALLASLALLALGASGLPLLQVDASNESYFVRGDPALDQYHDLLRRFGSDEVVYVLVDVGEDAFAPAHLEALLELGRALRQVPHALEVRSALHSPFPVDEGGALGSRSVERAAPAERAALRERVLGWAPFRGLLIDERAERVGFLVRLDGAVKAPAAREAMADALDRTLEGGPWARYPHAAVGTPLHGVLFARILRREVRASFASSLVAALLALALLFRAARATIAPLVVAAATVVSTLGLMGHAGVPVSTVTGILVTLLVVAGVADAMHVLSGYERRALDGAAPAEAWRAALEDALVPCVLTSLTTAFGLMALLTSGLAPLRDLGVMGSVGLAVAIAFTLGLLPPLLIDWRPRPGAATSVVDRWLARLLEAVAARPGRWALGGLLLTGVLAAGAARLRVDHDFLAYLDPDEPLRQRIEFVQARMGGAVAAEVVIDTDRPDGARRAAALQAVAGLEAWIRALHPRVRAVRGLPDTLIEAHALWGGPRAVPASDEAADQLLLVAESTDADLVEQHLTRDGASTRVTVRLDVMGSAEYQGILDALEAELPRRLGPVGARGHLTGAAVLLARMKDYVLDTQFSSFGLAFVLVGGLFLLLARSLRLGLLALVPNLAPIACVLGVMGWAGVALEVSNVLVATLALGIVVDDTVHFVWGLRAARARGLDELEALRETFHGAGRAVVFTALVLVLAFGAHGLSALQNLRAFGLLSALTFAVALVGELVLLPALLLVTGGGRADGSARGAPRE